MQGAMRGSKEGCAKRKPAAHDGGPTGRGTIQPTGSNSRGKCSAGSSGQQISRVRLLRSSYLRQLMDSCATAATAPCLRKRKRQSTEGSRDEPRYVPEETSLQPDSGAA